MTSAQATLTLAHSRGLGPRRIKLLVAHFGSAEAVLAAPERELAALEGFGPGVLAGLAAARRSAWPAEELRRAAQLGVKLLALEDAAYPAPLSAIYDPPPVLYLRGELSALEPQPRSVAVVGTRDASAYGLRFAETLGAGLAAAGVLVVSGLALGVDASAHAGALASGGAGRTAAVLGSGVDVLYPPQNAALARRIAEGGGALLSEQPLGSGPRPGNFPARNRIVSGLSRAVAVIEAGAKSGALITADLALEEGRTVFAAPGRAGDPRAAGALELLRQGATLLTDTADILSEFGWQAQARAGAQPSRSAPNRPELPPEQRELLEHIGRLGAPLLDDLQALTGASASELLGRLTLLELAGLVAAQADGRYTRLEG